MRNLWPRRIIPHEPIDSQSEDGLPGTEAGQHSTPLVGPTVCHLVTRKRTPGDRAETGPRLGQESGWSPASSRPPRGFLCAYNPTSQLLDTAATQFLLNYLPIITHWLPSRHCPHAPTLLRRRLPLQLLCLFVRRRAGRSPRSNGLRTCIRTYMCMWHFGKPFPEFLVPHFWLPASSTLSLTTF